jgi:hypothetical protein
VIEAHLGVNFVDFMSAYKHVTFSNGLSQSAKDRLEKKDDDREKGQERAAAWATRRNVKME